MNDIEYAKMLLNEGENTCVLTKRGAVYSSTERGIAPMVKWISSGTKLSGFSAADKIVGKAAAMLFILAGVKEVYAPVMSRDAIAAFERNGVRSSCETVADTIINRLGTGACPMEQAVAGIEDPSAAFAAVKKTLEGLRSKK